MVRTIPSLVRSRDIEGALKHWSLTAPFTCGLYPPCLSDKQTENEAEKIAAVNVFIVILSFHFGQDPGQELSHADSDASHAHDERAS